MTHSPRSLIRSLPSWSSTLRVVLTTLLSISLASTTTGCRWVAGFSPAPNPAGLCTAEVLLYPDGAAAPDLQISYFGLGKPAEAPELLRFDNGSRNVPFYRWGSRPEPFAPWVAEGFVPRELRGSWLVRVDRQDADLRGTLMTLEFRDPGSVETVWVAFDDRGGPPDWLVQAFESYGAGPESTLQSTERTPQDQPVRYRLYRLRGDVPTQLSLGGNNDPTAQWPAKPGSQYLVFVRPRPVPNLRASGIKVGEHLFETCWLWEDFSTLDLSPYLAKWVAKNPGWSWPSSAGLLGMHFVPGSCSAITSTSSSGQTQTKYCQEDGSYTWRLVNDWPRESRASVDPGGSLGRVSLDGDGPAQSPLRGEVSFRTFDDGRLVLDDVSLFAEPFDSGGHHVSEATFTHEAAIEAHCVGQSFPHRLCDAYRVSERELGLFVAAKVGSQRYSATLENEQPVWVDVDLNQRIFSFQGGPFSGAVLLENGAEIQVEASFDFLGRFENFAPVALANEGGDRFACTDQGRGRVRLDAGASLDEEGALASHLWIEDAGLSTQRVLATTETAELDLPFGSHEVTLIVEDQEGVLAFTTQDIEVADDTLDGASFPADVWAPSSGSQGGTTVPSNPATGNDNCSGQVLVRDDLPSEGRFPDGLTFVDWSVDDGHGNVLRHTQKVFVLPPPFHPPPIAEIAASPIVAFDGNLVIDFDTLPQGSGMTLDEYLVVTRYDGTRWTVDRRGSLGDRNDLRPRTSGIVLGVAPTSGRVVLTQPGELFQEEGPYAVEYVLVQPGRSPLDSSAIVSWAGAGWTLLP